MIGFDRDHDEHHLRENEGREEDGRHHDPLCILNGPCLSTDAWRVQVLRHIRVIVRAAKPRGPDVDSIPGSLPFRAGRAGRFRVMEACSLCRSMAIQKTVRIGEFEVSTSTELMASHCSNPRCSNAHSASHDTE